MVALLLLDECGCEMQFERLLFCCRFDCCCCEEDLVADDNWGKFDKLVEFEFMLLLFERLLLLLEVAVRPELLLLLLLLLFSCCSLLMRCNNSLIKSIPGMFGPPDDIE